MAVISRRGRGNMVAQTLARSKNWRLLSASRELLSASCRRLLMPRQFLGKGGIAGFLSEESKCFSLKNSRKNPPTIDVPGVPQAGVKTKVLEYVVVAHWTIMKT